MSNIDANADETKAGAGVRWVAVSTDMLSHPVLDKGPYDRRSAWLWLIANAARKNRSINHKGKPLDLKRGQLLAGRAFLAEQWGWSEKQVRSFLVLLLSEGMLGMVQSDGHYANVITICNYEKYQFEKKTERPEERPEKGQSGASAGPEEGQTYTQIQGYIDTKDSPRTTVEQEAARESAGGQKPDEIEGLNGSTAEIVAGVAKILNVHAPDIAAAKRIVQSNVGLYGPNAVRDGYAELMADLQDNQIRVPSIKVLIGYIKTAKERPSKVVPMQRPQWAVEKDEHRQRALAACGLAPKPGVVQ